MLKRIVAFTLALLITAVGLCAWWVLVIIMPLRVIPQVPTSLLLDAPSFIVSAALLVASIILFRRGRSLPIVLLFVGAVALFVAHLHDLFIGAGGDLALIGPRSFFFPGCLENPLVATPINVLRLVALCFPVGFLWYVTRAIERHLTRRASERLPAA